MILFKAQGASFDPEFEQAFKNSVYDHGLHIIQNLEWNPTLRSNHYLADIVGLLFVSSYLPRSPETDTWLAFSVQELSHAMEEQFHPDGSNFEASTSYHRLSAEMMLYGTALILGLPDSKREALKRYTPISLFPGLKLQKAPLPFFPVPGLDQTSPLPPTHFEKLERIADFTRAVMKPNGQAIQIGDNDSGRFLKLHPEFHKAELNEIHALYQNLHDYTGSESINQYWVEDHLNHSHLIRAIDALFGKQADPSEPEDIEARVICDLAGGNTLAPSNAKSSAPNISNYTFGTDSAWNEGKQKLDELSPEQCHTYEISAHGHNLKSGWSTSCFPDFGLYLMVSPKMFLSIRCGLWDKMETAVTRTMMRCPSNFKSMASTALPIPVPISTPRYRRSETRTGRSRLISLPLSINGSPIPSITLCSRWKTGRRPNASILETTVL